VTARSYGSPEAFKQAVEQRLRAATVSGGGLSRQRQLLVFGRFLARLVETFGDAITLKGGLALELRVESCTPTRCPACDPTRA
jgi:hypothetical protein